MSIELLMLAAKWFWDQYGKAITDSASVGIKEKWTKFKWVEAEERYRTRLFELYSTTMILGNLSR